MPSLITQCSAGLVLGLGLIMPIGAQNLYVINQGIYLGFPRVLLATLSTTVCDAILILVGTMGLGVALDTVRPLRVTLLSVGTAFLLYMTVQSVRVESAEMTDAATNMSTGTVIRRAVGASLLNPHAILDTVGVIGVVAASRQGLDKAWFASGAILASLLWFSFLGAAALVVRKRLTHRMRRVIAYVSASLMLVFACTLLAELLSMLQVT